MTQVAEPGTTTADGSTPGRVSHWIGGRTVAGASGREGPVYDPATGRIARYVDFAIGRRGGDGRRGGQGRVPGLAGDVDLEADRRHVQDPEPRRDAPQGPRGAAHRRARQGPVRCPRRDRPRPREPRVRVRHRQPDEGRLLRAGLRRRRRLPDPPAARRGRRHHAVQLPGDGPDVDVRHGHRDRQHVHPQAVREGPVGGQLHGRAAGRGRRARTASSTSSTATRSRSTRSSSTPTSPRSRSSGRPRSRATSTRPGRRRASGSRRSVAPRTT